MCVFHFDRKSKMAAITWNGYNIRPIIEWSFMKFYVFLCWSEIKDGDHHRTSLTYMCNLSETTEETNLEYALNTPLQNVSFCVDQMVPITGQV